MFLVSLSEWTGYTSDTLQCRYSVNLQVVPPFISCGGKLDITVSHIFLRWFFIIPMKEWMASLLFIFLKNTFAMIWWSPERNKCARNHATVWFTWECLLCAVLCNFQQLIIDELLNILLWMFEIVFSYTLTLKVITTARNTVSSLTISFRTWSFKHCVLLYILYSAAAIFKQITAESFCEHVFKL